MNRIVSLGLLFCGAVLGQSFEVASVKPAGPPPVGQGTYMRGGPGTNDPGQITYSRVFLVAVLWAAFGVKDFQLSGPEWLETEHYDIIAKIPAGATREQFGLMLQNLLIERFGLKFHHEQKNFPVYELVLANGGPKLKESDPAAGAAPEPSGRTPPVLDRDGFPVLLPGANFVQSLKNWRNRVSARMTIAELAGQLARETGRRVTDKTGLTGKYDLKLDYSVEGLGGQRWVARAQQGLDAGTPNDGGPDLFTAIQQQLGLKLEDRKAPYDVIVIDHIEKVPTGN